jgi:hypothetical protein
MPQCTAKSKQKGVQCRQPAIRGGNVCRVHGGSAPQVRKKAEERIAALLYPAVHVLDMSMKGQKKRPDIALMAAKEVIELNGLKKAQKHELTGADGSPLSVQISFVKSTGE